MLELEFQAETVLETGDPPEKELDVEGLGHELFDVKSLSFRLGGLYEVWKDPLLALQVGKQGVDEDADDLDKSADVVKGESLNVGEGIEQALAVCKDGALEGCDVGVSVVILVNPGEEGGDLKVEVGLEEGFEESVPLAHEEGVGWVDAAQHGEEVDDLGLDGVVREDDDVQIP